MFSQPIYSPQTALDRINNQMAELERQRTQLQQIPMQQPTNLTQNFQISPTNNNSMRYAETMEEVKKDLVIGDTPYFSKDMSVVWIKNTKGEIKTYELKEIILKDEKDLMIESLQEQINELKKGIKENEQINDDYVREPIESKKSSNVSNARTSKK